MYRAGFRTRMFALGAAGLAAAALLAPRPGTAHEGEAHLPPDLASLPLDEFVFGDAMRLIATDFSTLRNEGAGIADPEAHAKVLRATVNAQRYMRTVKRRWTPDRGFTTHADAFLTAWAQAEGAVRAGDAARLQGEIQAIGATCKACHEAYRDE